MLGMYEYNAVLNESRQAIFPNDFPNSTGYQIYSQERVNSLCISFEVIVCYSKRTSKKSILKSRQLKGLII